MLCCRSIDVPARGNRDNGSVRRCTSCLSCSYCFFGRLSLLQHTWKHPHHPSAIYIAIAEGTRLRYKSLPHATTLPISSRHVYFCLITISALVVLSCIRSYAAHVCRRWSWASELAFPGLCTTNDPITPTLFTTCADKFIGFSFFPHLLFIQRVPPIRLLGNSGQEPIASHTPTCTGEVVIAQHPI